MNKIFLNNIGDLNEAQRASFYRFLTKGISEELANFPNPFIARIKTTTRVSEEMLPCFVYLYTNDLKLKGPEYTLEYCLKTDRSYAIQLYIAAEYSYLFEKKLDIKKPSPDISFIQFEKSENTKKKKNLIKRVRVNQHIFFGDIPLMTEEGTFVITGCERVIISQIIRSPGIYFKKELGTRRRKFYTATIISNKGTWTKIILDNKRLPKSTAFSDEDRIYIKLNTFKFEPQLKEDEDKNDDDKLFLYDLLKYFGLSEVEISQSLKYPLLLKNQQLERIDGSDKNEIALAVNEIFFNPKSCWFSIGEIGRYKINKKLGLNLPKEITYLTPHDFIRVIDGLMELKYYGRISDDIDHIKNKQIRSVGDLLQNQIRIGFYRLKESLERGASFEEKAYYDIQDTVYQWIVDPRPLTSSLKEFFKTSQLSQYMDQVNPLAELTHKRRISVFGPNGLKRDHISTVIRDIHPSQYGRLCPIETPEGQNVGLITSVSMYGRISAFGWIETPYFLLKDNILYSDKTPIFLNPQQESETKIAFADIPITNKNKIQKEYLSTKEDYSFSSKKQNDVNFVTTSPLQIISLATSLIPFVEHDDANRALMGSNMQRQAVPLIYSQKPIIGTGFEAVAVLDSGMVIKTYCQGTVLFSSAHVIQVQDLSAQVINYYLRKYYRSNQETCINQRPIVWAGEDVFSGQVIADGPSTNDGELSLGRNLTIGYMPWEGYNYEDAIIINEKIIYKDFLTSIHIEEHETNLSYSSEGNEKLTNNLPHLTKYVCRHLDKEGLVKIGSYVKEHDILVGKLTPCEEDQSGESKLIRALFGQKQPSFRDTSLKVPQGTEGRVIDVRLTSTNGAPGRRSYTPLREVIRIYIAQIRKIQVGDKLAGRHGNKGIVSRVLSRQDMPYLPDGTPIDIIFNPLGVPSRMNVGQVLECLLGLAGEKLGTRFKISPFDEIYGKEASRVLVNQKLKEAAIKTNQPWLFDTHCPGKILLRDGRTGEYFDNPITVGKSYILKLIHLVEDKIHARATGPYAMITEQPLAGKSQKGGQRFGEMEVWALEAYGCSNTLQELLTIKSDDIDGRNDMYEAILVRKDIEKPTPSLSEAFLALIRELQALGLDFSIRKIENGFYSATDMKDIEKDMFSDIEARLKLRTLLSRKKVEQFSKATNEIDPKDIFAIEKNREKKKLLDKLKNQSKQNPI